jgi:acyl-CoA oxidase
MIGCYAQTEVGHGSNVRALETTATFLSEHKGGQPGGTFVINSRTLIIVILLMQLYFRNDANKI